MREDDIDFQSNELGCELGEAFAASLRPAIFDREIAAVDPDIDIRNSAEVEWAKSVRVKPREDVFVVDRTAAAPLDPATDGGFSSSVGIDATIPIGADFPEVSEVPGWKDFALPEIEKLSA